MTTSPSAACSGRLAGFADAVHSGRDLLHELVDAFAGPRGVTSRKTSRRSLGKPALLVFP